MPEMRPVDFVLDDLLADEIDVEIEVDIEAVPDDDVDVV